MNPRKGQELGARPSSSRGTQSTRFSVWAPSAARVSVVGSFNDWQGGVHPLVCDGKSGVWTGSVAGAGPGDRYMFEIEGPDGVLLPRKADPCAFRCAEENPAVSVVWEPAAYRWSDDAWMKARAGHHVPERPLCIYEVHAGSWRRRGPAARFLTWRELARELIPWVRDRGFTHIELLPITEHPFYGSWGYQPTSLYAPTARYGPPEDLQYFIDRCHHLEIGVLLDWVPAHFPGDPWALAEFDGTHLYEYADPHRGRHPEWGTRIYDYSRPEVVDFLVGSALHWLDSYHVDGLRVDAVASMLYLDYARGKGAWTPNEHGGNEHLEAVAFIRRLNEEVHARFPGALTIAEESTAWPGVSRPVSSEGLGFDYKWDMGWMNDTLDYIRREPAVRSRHHQELTFGFSYVYSEDFILPLSHDEVVYGKGTLLNKMPGGPKTAFAGLRAYLAFQYTHPGKKLLFMGSEFAQRPEWDHDGELAWDSLDDPSKRGVCRLLDDLNRIYRSDAALHEGDCRSEGFSWLEPDDRKRCVLVFERRGIATAEARLIVICNFSDRRHRGYRIGVPELGDWKAVVDTDRIRYGGRGRGPKGRLAADDVPWHGRPCSIALDMPPLTTLVLSPSARPSSGAGRREGRA